MILDECENIFTGSFSTKLHVKRYTLYYISIESYLHFPLQQLEFLENAVKYNTKWRNYKH